MNLPAPELNGLPVPAAQRIGEREDAGFGLKCYACAEAIRCVCIPRVFTVVLVPRIIGEEKEP